MIPNIPDNVYKILLAVGLFLIAYTYLQKNRYEDLKNEAARRFDIINDSLSLSSQSIIRESKQIEELSKDLSLKLGISGLVTSKDSLLVFKRVFEGKKNEVTATALIQKKWNEYKLHKYAATDKGVISNRRLNQLNSEIENYNITLEEIYQFTIIGGIITFLGFIGMLYTQVLSDKILENQVDESKKIRDCESCGKRFNASVIYAKFSDGTINTHYCSECFNDDKFAEPDLKFIDAVGRYISAMGRYSRYDKYRATSKFAKMRRWKNGNY